VEASKEKAGCQPCLISLGAFAPHHYASVSVNKQKESNKMMRRNPVKKKRNRNCRPQDSIRV
jgi:hypothetical protein